MSAAKYTPEPWPTYAEVAVVMTPDPNGPDAAAISFEDYQRAKKCVDACAGMSDPVVSIRMGREALGCFAERTREIDFLTQQRDDLLATLEALKIALRLDDPTGHYDMVCDAISEARA